MTTTDTPCRCTSTDKGTDRASCPRHDIDEAVCLALAQAWGAEITEAGRQWELDHPNGISAEEDEAMARYAYEACRDEGCRDE